MRRVVLCCWLVAAFCSLPGTGWTQLIAVDDSFGVPVLQTLLVETPGVLQNDSYNNEPAEDGGATVELLTGPVHGTLECESNAALKLCADGSFNYMPGAGFPGSDSFTYRASVGAETAEAKAALTACQGGPVVFVCWKESEYLAKLAELGYSTFHEGFEDDTAWAAARSPDTTPSAISQGIKWESNHPAAPALNKIITGPGPALNGQWAIFDQEHGYATGTQVSCDVDDPDVHCLHKDGFTGTRQPGESMLYAMGGHFTGSAKPKLVMILDGGAPISMGNAPSGHQFYGVINTAGFITFRVEETDGKIGQARHVFADDFIFGISSRGNFEDGFE